MTADDAFTRIETALSAHLQDGGFIQRTEESHPEAFGSRYAEYGDGAANLRLIWDGKENHFVLECDRLPNETKAGPWIDLLVMRFDPRSSEAETWLSAISHEFARAVANYIGQWTTK